MKFFHYPILICISVLFVRRAISDTINNTDNSDTCDRESAIQINGSFRCICEAGYEIQDDKKTCKVGSGEGLLIYSAKRSIHSYYLESGIYFPITRNSQHAVDMDAVDTDWIYWLDQREEVIMRSSRNFTKSEVIVSSGLGLPEEIAVDWTTGNIYYTDSLYKHIGVCNNDGTQCTTIISGASYMLRGLALYPQSGVMFWSDYGKKPHISTAGMDGKDDKPLITKKLGWPNGLAIDYPKKRLYWVDAKLDVIESVRLDGSDRREVLRIAQSHPYSIAIFGNLMYWSEWKTESIQFADKYSGNNRTTLISGVDTIYGIHICHPVLRPRMSNPCETKPCSQLCLLAMNRTYSCACIRDHELNADGHSCTSTRNRERLLISTGNTLIEYHNEIQGKPNTTEHQIAHRLATNIAYDPTNGTILGSDKTSNSIFGFGLKSGEIWKIMNVITDHTGDISFDYYANNLYRSDAHHRTIEIYSLETAEKTVLHFIEEPWNILLIPEYAIMYVVFKSVGVYHIDKLRMNGVTLRNRIVEDIEGPKISLAYDSELERVFWADQGTGRIESISVLGTDRKLLRLCPQRPFGLVVLGDDIFWSIEGSKQLLWTDKENTISNITRVTIPLPDNSVIEDLIAIDSVFNEIRHMCRTNNGDCSHVCLVDTIDSRICACPPGMYLRADMQTCDWGAVCTFDEIRCSDNNFCINKMQRCNGIEDCPSGEDEVECYCTSANNSLETTTPY